MQQNFKKLAGMALSALIAAGIGLAGMGSMPEAQAAHGHTHMSAKQQVKGHWHRGYWHKGRYYRARWHRGHHHMMGAKMMRGHMMSMMKCGNVKVTGKMAYLKAMPSMGSRTLRVAHWGEPLMVVRNSMGHAHHMNGWVLVKRSSGYRYWAHHSMLGCR